MQTSTLKQAVPGIAADLSKRPETEKKRHAVSGRVNARAFAAAVPKTERQEIWWLSLELMAARPVLSRTRRFRPEILKRSIAARMTFAD